MAIFRKLLIGVVAWLAFSGPILARESELLSGDAGALVFALLVSGVLPLVLRYRFPTLSLSIALIISLSLQALGSLGPSVALLVGLALFEFNQRYPLRLAVIATIGSASIVSAYSFAAGAAPEAIWLAHFAFIGLAGTIGRAIRVQQKLIAETEQRAIQAEKSRDAKAAEEVAKERLLIARELHDSIGHRLSVINLQAQSIEQSDSNLNSATKKSLREISESSREALSEIGVFLESLRGHTRDLPQIPEFETIINQFRLRGLKIRSETLNLSSIAELERREALTKGLRESLNNAEKYGDGEVDILFLDQDNWVHVSISNQIKDGHQGQKAGLGLIGIRERLELLGGTVSAKSENNRFVLTMSLPKESQ